MSNASSNTSSNTSNGLLSKSEICSAPIKTEVIFHSAFLILILLVTFVGNLMVLLAVIFFRRLRSITNYFICSLAVSDLLIACLSLPFRLDQNIHNAHWCRSLETCKTWLMIDTMCTIASMWNLAVISVDRFMAIKRPFHYHSLMTQKVGYGLISTVWTYSAFLALMILINWTEQGAPHFTTYRECGNKDPVYYTVVASTSFFLPLLIILVMYGIVFEVALNQTKAMAALEVNTGRGRGGRRSSINLVREVKAAKTLAIVIGCFVVCWLPFNIILMILLWNRELITKGLSDDVKQFLSLTFIYIFPALNSTLNPIIYALFNRDFRSAFMKLAKRVTGNRLGAVGYGDTMMSSATTRFNSTVDEHTIKGPSKGIRFKDHESDSSDQPLPTIPQVDLNSYNNEAYTDQQKPLDNNLIVNADTQSMETTLDDGKKTATENNDATSQNGHVNNDEHTNNDVTKSDNDVIKNEVGDSSKVNKIRKLPPIQKSLSLSSTEQSTQPEPSLVKQNTLPPIESNSKDFDINKDADSTQPDKTLDISPDIIKKSNDVTSSTDKVEGDNTAL